MRSWRGRGVRELEEEQGKLGQWEEGRETISSRKSRETLYEGRGGLAFALTPCVVSMDTPGGRGPFCAIAFP